MAKQISLDILLGIDTTSEEARIWAANQPGGLISPPGIYDQTTGKDPHMILQDLQNLTGLQNLRLVSPESLPKEYCENCLFEYGSCKTLDKLAEIDTSWEEKQQIEAEIAAKEMCTRELFTGAALNGLNIDIKMLKEYIEEFITVTNRNEQLGETNREDITEEITIDNIANKGERAILTDIAKILSNIEAKELSDYRYLAKYEIGINVGTNTEAKREWKKVAIITIKAMKKDNNKVIIGPNTWISPRKEKISTIYKVRGPINIPNETGDTEVTLRRHKISGKKFFVATLDLANPSTGAIYKYSLLFSVEQMKIFIIHNQSDNWFKAHAKPFFVSRYGIGGESAEGWIPNIT